MCDGCGEELCQDCFFGEGGGVCSMCSGWGCMRESCVAAGGLRMRMCEECEETVCVGCDGGVGGCSHCELDLCAECCGRH